MEYASNRKGHEMNNPVNGEIRGHIVHALNVKENPATKISDRDGAKALGMVNFAQGSPSSVATVISESVPERFSEVETDLYSDNFRHIRKSLRRIQKNVDLTLLNNQEIGDLFRKFFSRHGEKWLSVPNPDFTKNYGKRFKNIAPSEWSRCIKLRQGQAESLIDNTETMTILLDAAHKVSAKDMPFVNIF